MSIQISKKATRSLIASHIKENTNKKYIVDMLINTLDSSSLSSLIDICLATESYNPFSIGDIVSFESDGDVNLLDYGMWDGINERYAVILQSDNYGDTFNPYYYKMQVGVFDLDKDNKVIIDKRDIYSNELTILLGERAQELKNILADQPPLTDL